MPDEGTRSQQACPVCGRHELALVDFPHVSATGVQPYAELLGMGDPRTDVPPGIACLACGTEWADLDAFRAGRPLPRGPEEPAR